MGINFPHGVSSKNFDKKIWKWILFKSNILYIIGKLLKHKYPKWSCILNLRLWTKSYNEKKSWKSNFLGEKWTKLPFPSRRREKGELPSPSRNNLGPFSLGKLFSSKTWLRLPFCLLLPRENSFFLQHLAWRSCLEALFFHPSH